MPTYSFKCSKCNHKWQEFAWMSEKDKVKCPVCGEKAEDDYNDTSNSSVMIQGKGFYQEKTIRK